ncbi:uncharacterized protein [Diadema setosum]|uniref:uncharacterized protein n=1 Tax=Diadema setosum TaxID=31175 RepID=UPI003B3B170B
MKSILAVGCVLVVIFLLTAEGRRGHGRHGGGGGPGGHGGNGLIGNLASRLSEKVCPAYNTSSEEARANCTDAFLDGLTTRNKSRGMGRRSVTMLSSVVCRENGTSFNNSCEILDQICLMGNSSGLKKCEGEGGHGSGHGHQHGHRRRRSSSGSNSEDSDDDDDDEDEDEDEPTTVVINTMAAVTP